MLTPGRATSLERVGKEWTARVVRAGRTPPDYEAAYEDLADLVAVRGIDLDDGAPGQLVVGSVDTDEGPGIALSISYRVEDEPTPKSTTRTESSCSKRSPYAKRPGHGGALPGALPRTV